MSESAQSSVPATQRAWVLHKTGGHPRDILKLEDCAVPTPTGKQLLVRVHAAALNREQKAQSLINLIAWGRAQPVFLFCV
jgi:hypothetical protein